MRLLAIPGHWYCEALPSGIRASAQFHGPVRLGLYDEHATVLPDREVQWLRLSPDGIRCAGTGAQDDHAWEWDGTAWQDRGPFKAPRAVLYQSDGQLYVERDAAWPGSGSQGWRYVDDNGVKVPAYATYADAARNIYEYTTRGAVTIGQGGSGGVEALVDGKRIRLDHLFINADGSRQFPEDANCNAVNFNQTGDQIAVSWYVAHSPVSYTACIVWISLADLRALPSATAPLPSVPQPVDPPIQPSPTPEPKPMSVPVTELRRLADALRAQKPLLVPNQPSFPFCVAVAQSLGGAWGLNGKRGNKNDPSRDVLVYKDADGKTIHLYDCIGDAADPNANWQGANSLQIPGESDQGEIHQDGDGGVWLDPKSFVAVTSIPSTATGQPPASNTDAQLAAVIAKLASLQTDIAQIKANQQSDHDALVAVTAHVESTVAPDLSVYAKYGDRVEVSGRISFGLNKWGGSIVKP